MSARPQRFLSNPVQVAAIHHDGSAACIAAITGWVQQVAGRPITALLDRDVLISNTARR